MTTTEIITAIGSIDDPAELARIAHAAQRRAQGAARRAYRQGDEVAFTTRGGRTITGIVERVNTKTVTVVNCVDDRGRGHRGYRVPPTMLRSAKA